MEDILRYKNGLWKHKIYKNKWIRKANVTGMKDLQLRRVVINLIMPVLAGIILILFSGCGGSVAGDTPQNPSAEVKPTEDGTGRFIVTVNFPSASARLGGRYIPLTRKWLHIMIFGEKIDSTFSQPAMVQLPSTGGSFTTTINNIPVGLNEAVIRILDEGEVLLAQRRVGFYMKAGQSISPAGPIHMGVAILPDGRCEPSQIRLQSTSDVLYWENWDEQNGRTVKMTGPSSVEIGPISKVTLATQPNNVATFASASYTFSTNGKYNYDSGFGAPGFVRVGPCPTLTSIVDGDGNDYDTNISSSSVSFTLTGTNFGTTSDTVRFCQDPDHGGRIFTVSGAAISTWNNTSIQGTVTLPEGNYMVSVSVGGELTTDIVYFYKTDYSWRFVRQGAIPFYDMADHFHFIDLYTTRHSDVWNGQLFSAQSDIDKSNYMSVLKYGGTNWEVVGSRGFSGRTYDNFALSVYNGTPYAYNHNYSTQNITCYKFNGGAWEMVGAADFSPAGTDEFTSTFYNGTPYVAFWDDGASDGATVMKFNGASWELVGPQNFSGCPASWPQINFWNGTPYVAYWEYSTTTKLSCMKYNGNSWEYVGSRGFSKNNADWLSQDIYNGAPYVAYHCDADERTYCMKFNGADWENVGPAVSDANANSSLWPSISVSSGTPYVAYFDAYTDVVRCRKFNGTSWADTGLEQLDIYGEAIQLIYENGILYMACSDAVDNDNVVWAKYNGIYWSKIPKYWASSVPMPVSDGLADIVRMQFYNGTPYIAYMDMQNGDKATCKKYNSTSYTWETVGSVGFSGVIYNTYDNSLSFALDNDTPYAAYVDNTTQRTNCMKFNGTAWEAVGNADFSPSWVTKISLAASGGTPYLAFRDGSINELITCMKLNAGTWEVVGSSGFSPGDGTSFPNLKFYNGTPYIAYFSGQHKFSYEKFNGTSWEIAGDGIYAKFAGSQVSFFLENDTQYVVYRDYGSSRDNCKKYNGTSWELLGSADFGAATPNYNSLFVYNATPYIAYRDGLNNKLTCRALNAGAWDLVGARGFTESASDYPKTFVDAGTAYVAYRDSGTAPGNKLTCKKFNGNSWETLGARGFTSSAVGADQHSFYIYNGTPYVAFRDAGSSNKMTCQLYNSSATAWQNVGAAGFSNAVATSPPPSLFIDNGTPYVAYKENTGGKGSCMKFNGNSWEQVGTASFTSGVVNYSLSLSVSGDTPYFAYQDGAAGRLNRVTCMKYDAGAWSVVGSPAYSEDYGDTGGYGATNYLKIQIYNGTPYTAHTVEAPSRPTCQKFNGTSWEFIGSAALYNGMVGYPSLYVYNGTPYVSYQESNKVGYKCSARKYTGAGPTGWEQIGSAGFSSGMCDMTNICVDEASGIPYVAHADYAGTGVDCSTVQKYTGAGATGWETVGVEYFSETNIGGFYLPLCIYGGVPYVAFAYPSQGAFVMKYDNKP